MNPRVSTRDIPAQNERIHENMKLDLRQYIQMKDAETDAAISQVLRALSSNK